MLIKIPRIWLLCKCSGIYYFKFKKGYIGEMKKPKSSQRKSPDALPDGMLSLDLLQQKILANEFEIGQHIRENVLATEFGVNRNAIRNALNQLVAWRVFEYVPFCGYRVRNFQVKDIIECCELRLAIEPPAARRLAILRPDKALARLRELITLEHEAILNKARAMAGRYDHEFHYEIVVNCGNNTFAWLQNSIRLIMPFLDQLAVPRMAMENPDPDGSKTIGAHNRILQCIKEGDAEKAENEARIHCSRMLRQITAVAITM